MYSIGQFSKMMEVSTKTLRHYDEMGLFAPFKIDEVNGYRYYSSEQINGQMRISIFSKIS